MKKHRIFVLLIQIVVLVLLSCGPTDPSEESSSTIISENVVVLDALSGVTIQSITDNQVVLNFSQSTPDISTGDCIISGQVVGDFYGCIRIASSIDIQGNTMTIQTSDARLTDAVIQCSVDTTYSLTMSKMVRRPSAIYFDAMDGVTTSGKGLILTDVTLYSGNVGGANLTVRIISGSIEFEPDMDIGWQIENSQIVEFHAIATGDLVFNCDIEGIVDGSLNFSADTTLASFSRVYVQFVGWLPVVEVVTLSFVGGFDVAASATASVQTGFNHSNTISVGAEYEGSWSSVWEYNPQLLGHQTDWNASGEFEIRGYVRPTVSVDFYGVLGPYLESEPYLAWRFGIGINPDRVSSETPLDGHRYADRIRAVSEDYASWWWELVGGITGKLGFNISILGYSLADFNCKLFEWEIILDDSCSVEYWEGTTGQGNPISFNVMGDYGYDLYFLVSYPGGSLPNGNGNWIFDIKPDGTWSKYVYGGSGGVGDTSWEVEGAFTSEWDLCTGTIACWDDSLGGGFYIETDFMTTPQP